MYEGRFPLSLKDMCAIDILPQLLDAGITSFKIEGRMKNSEYVYYVTKIYRKYIDMYCRGDKYIVDAVDRKKLTALYTRSGNCEGYYRQHNGRDMITEDSPSYNSEAGAFDTGGLPAPVDVNIRCSIKCGEKAVITVYNSEHSIERVTDITADKAINRALSEEEIQRALKKSGGSGFNVKECDVVCDSDVFLPKSQLNEIRREGLSAFKNVYVLPYRRGEEACRRREYQRIEKGSTNHEPQTLPAVNVSVLGREQFDAAKKSPAEGIIIPVNIFEDCDLSATDKKIYAALPYIIRDEDRGNSSGAVLDFVKKISKDNRLSGCYISNFEAANILYNSAYTGEVVADTFMYAYNREAYDYYKRRGIDKTTVPAELSIRELILRGICGEELVIYGRMPVMVSANCVYNTLKGCRPSGHFMYLTDRKHEKLFVNCICGECTNVIYNSVCTSIADEEVLFDKLTPSSVRFSFTDETPEEVSRILGMYFDSRTKSGSAPVHFTGKYTKGHLRRGVI